MEETRSPLKDKPLRNPGQSLRDERMDILFDKLMAPLMLSMLLVMLAAVEWGRYYFPSPSRPWVTTVCAALGVAYALWHFRKHWPRLKTLRLAEDGEKAVGQFLDTLRESGYQVFHDVIGEGFNVDHVIIGPSGIYTIETKTWKKPQRGSPEIQFDGEHLTAAGRTPDRDPVIQAKAQAGWLKQLLQASTGKSFTVRPVVLFPGWYIKASRESRRDVWVLEPKALPSFLGQVDAQIAPDDLKLAAFHLSRFIRSQERRFDEEK
jgi:hypothetical protein